MGVAFVDFVVMIILEMDKELGLQFLLLNEGEDDEEKMQGALRKLARVFRDYFMNPFASAEL